MPCLACRTRVRLSHSLCAVCLRGLGGPRDVLTPGGVFVAAAATHQGSARALVHRLKYEGLGAAADLIAGLIAARLPSGASALVPVPRALGRRWRHGVDPASELARATGRLCGIPVRPMLRPRVWYPHRNGARSRRRGVPEFTCVGSPTPGVVLVDDVVTTGMTLDAAAAAIGDVHHAVVATVGASRMALRDHDRSR